MRKTKRNYIKKIIEKKRSGVNASMNGGDAKKVQCLMFLKTIFCIA